MLKYQEDRESGFTLIELLVVILIIGILASIAIPVFLNQRQKAIDSSVESDLKNAATQVETWAINSSGAIVPLPNMSDPTTASQPRNSSLASIKVSSGTTLYFYGNSNSFCISGINPRGNVADATVETGDNATPAATYYMIDTTTNNTSSINLRNAPNGTVITTIPNGGVVKATGNISGDWKEVTYNNITGWVGGGSAYTKSVTFTETQVYTVDTINLGPKNGGNLNLRTGPGTNHSIITSLPNGTKANGTGNTSTGEGSTSQWIEVYYGNSKGWLDGAVLVHPVSKTPTATSPGNGGDGEGFKYSSSQSGLQKGLCSGTLAFSVTQP